MPGASLPAQPAAIVSDASRPAAARASCGKESALSPDTNCARTVMIVFLLSYRAPETSMIVPDTYDASGERSHSTAAATSSALPARFIGNVGTIAAKRCGF